MIGRLGEIIVYVKDMAKQVAFYRDVLGLRIVEPTDVGDYDDAYWVVFDTGACRLALHGGGGKRFGEDAPKFVFFVEDIKVARSKLMSAGVAVGEVRSPTPGVSVVDCTDPEGNAFSIETQ